MNKGWTHGKDIHNAQGKAIRHSLSAKGIKNKAVTMLHKTSKVLDVPKPDRLVGWKMTQSVPSIKPTMEGWFIAWRKGREEIEIIRYYDDDRHRWGGFEVWNQTKSVSDDSWNGTHLATFNTVDNAVRYAKNAVRHF